VLIKKFLYQQKHFKLSSKEKKEIHFILNLTKTDNSLSLIFFDYIGLFLTQHNLNTWKYRNSLAAGAFVSPEGAIGMTEQSANRIFLISFTLNRESTTVV